MAASLHSSRGGDGRQTGAGGARKGNSENISVTTIRTHVISAPANRSEPVPLRDREHRDDAAAGIGSPPTERLFSKQTVSNRPIFDTRK